MRLWSKIALLLAFTPLVASAQYKDLDTAMSSLTRGFGSGDPQAIVAGIAPGDQVVLQFPGLVDQSGTVFGRDQAAYLLDALFSKVKPTGFDQQGTRGNRAQGQYTIVATWTIQAGGKSESRELYITLQNKNDRWALASVRTAGK
jgi:hypothetical protein